MDNLKSALTFFEYNVGKSIRPDDFFDWSGKLLQLEILVFHVKVARDCVMIEAGATK